MRRIAVLNQKGGVGKTTTAANLAAAVHRSGRRVLLIDLDPQAHLSLHFGLELADGQPSIYDLLISSTPVNEVIVKLADGLALVPADIDLAAAEAELISVTGREVVLREAVAGVDKDFDVMLVDCPPSLGVLTINALSAVDEIIIPLQGHFFSLHGLSKLLDTVTLVRQRINPQLTIAGLVLCMHDKGTRLAGEVVEDLTRFLEAARGQPVAWADARLYETFVRRNIKLAEASSFGRTIFDYAPRSNGAADYAGLAAEVFGLATTPKAGRTVAVQEATPTAVDSGTIRVPVKVPPAGLPGEVPINPGNDRDGPSNEHTIEPSKGHASADRGGQTVSSDAPKPCKPGPSALCVAPVAEQRPVREAATP